MTQIQHPITIEVAMEKGRQARAQAVQDAYKAVRRFLAARLHSEVTA